MTCILMYHALSETATSEAYTVTTPGFEQHLVCIKASGRPVLTVAEYCRRRVDNAVVITFDDGHGSNLSRAVPLLRKFGYAATFYLTTDWVGKRSDWLDWEGVRALIDCGMDVGAHGHTHAFMDDLDEQALTRELEAPRRLIRERAGADAVDMALPGGRYKRTTLACASDLGYRSVATSEPGLNNAGTGSSPMILSRYAVTQATSPDTFRAMVNLNPEYARSAARRYRAKKLVKRMLGNRLYQKAWSLLRK